ncbi:MAG: carbohydrate porin, partial [Methyloceanibacter sp.]
MRFCQVLGFGSAGLLMAALLGVIVPAAAHADCDVPQTGVAEEAVPIDFSGIRKSLAENGLAIGGYYAAETFGNPTGGFKQGATYDGVLELHLNADMRKLGLWKGLCFYTDAFQIHGRSITADYVRSLVTVSNTEATPATKLYELWLQQSLFNKHLSVRVGSLPRTVTSSSWKELAIGSSMAPGAGRPCLTPICPMAAPLIHSQRPGSECCSVLGKITASRSLSIT